MRKLAIALATCALTSPIFANSGIPQPLPLEKGGCTPTMDFQAGERYHATPPFDGLLFTLDSSLADKVKINNKPPEAGKDIGENPNAEPTDVYFLKPIKGVNIITIEKTGRGHICLNAAG